MTYNVFDGTLNPTLLVLESEVPGTCRGVLITDLRSSVLTYVGRLHWGQWENLYREFSRNL